MKDQSKMADVGACVYRCSDYSWRHDVQYISWVPSHIELIVRHSTLPLPVYRWLGCLRLPAERSHFLPNSFCDVRPELELYVDHESDFYGFIVIIIWVDFAIQTTLKLINFNDSQIFVKLKLKQNLFSFPPWKLWWDYLVFRPNFTKHCSERNPNKRWRRLGFFY